MSTKGFLGTEIEGEINRLEIKRRRDDEEEEGEGEGGEEREILSKNIFFSACPSKSAITKQMESSAAPNKSENKMKKVESGEGNHSVKITALMVK